MRDLENLVNAWRSVNPSSQAPRILSGDEGVLDLPYTKCGDYESYRDNIEKVYNLPGALHLGLVPVPYVGSLRTASVYILMLNPGMAPLDFYAESSSEYVNRKAWKMLHQELDDDDFPNPCFDLNGMWTGGSRYWLRKFDGIIENLIEKEGFGFSEAIKLLSQRVAIVQYFPYRSKSFHVGGRILSRLKSVELIKKFVRSYISEKVGRGEACAIVARQAKRWEFPDKKDGVVVFTGQQARSAHLNEASEAGKLIIRYLTKS